MAFTRRTFMRTALATGIAGALPLRGFAAQTMTLGGATLETVSDGNLVLPMNFVTDHEGALEKMASLGVTGDQVTPPCNVTLYRDGTNTVLFDVGAGPDFMPTAGKLLDTLDAMGVSPDEITHVVFTHGHPDHLWGVLDDFDDPLFANATHMMGKDEFDYWINPETVNTIDEGRQSFAAGALRRLQAMEDQIETFGADQEILPGIKSHASYGHTPGHMAFELRQGNDAVMIVGDAIGNHHLAFAAPDWVSGSDQNPDLGIETRMALLAYLADQQMPMVGFHLPEGGIGRVERADGVFRFVPEV
ncbi:MBL fold metallo-hydrolase [Pseudothioclava nitratireducens]|uniref:MBL fold metallo-hydrolase n=1 Tax=Pseudothioclava nitratireducens TaxID=1928646 RepID=UPI0023DB6516|nr:MBL fold metallo-hydrolase [Defluviimonas nitratireducens]MDF1620630.1 MBL fold metallo-hydrolase [Defluviimonas nitratireducens]